MAVWVTALTKFSPQALEGTCNFTSFFLRGHLRAVCEHQHGCRQGNANMSPRSLPTPGLGTAGQGHVLLLPAGIPCTSSSARPLTGTVTGELRQKASNNAQRVNGQP